MRHKRVAKSSASSEASDTGTEEAYRTSRCRLEVGEVVATDSHVRWRLPGADDFVPDLYPADVSAEVRGLMEVCLVLFNANEFLHVD